MQEIPMICVYVAVFQGSAPDKGAKMQFPRVSVSKLFDSTDLLLRARCVLTGFNRFKEVFSKFFTATTKTGDQFCFHS